MYILTGQTDNVCAASAISPPTSMPSCVLTYFTPPLVSCRVLLRLEYIATVTMGFDQEAFAAADAITHKVRTIITLSNVFACFGLWLAFKMLQAFWNVSPLHPLSRIPGPPLAAATYLPEFYYNVIKGGFYSAEISKMHAKYGECRWSNMAVESESNGINR